MAHSTIHLTQSRYYSPVFNAAVFDGPIRIYFAQHQEDLALKVYFRLQQYLKDTYSSFRNRFKQHGQTVFLMIYPSRETFEVSFVSGQESVEAPQVSVERLGDDFVLGVRGPVSDDSHEQVFAAIKEVLQTPTVHRELSAL